MAHVRGPMRVYNQPVLLFLLALLLLNHKALAIRGAQTPNTLIKVPRPTNLPQGLPTGTLVPSGECDCRMILRTYNPAPMNEDCRDWCIWRWAWY